MFKIGDFSKLAQVSVKTLRYYAQLGLLEPVWVDRYSGYRYYTLKQLPRLNRILALKDLGFSLEQIQGMLREDLAASELRGMLRLKQAELERQVQDEQMRLKRIQARMRQIEQEGRLPAYDVVLKQVAPLRVAGIREVIPEISQVPGLFARLQGALGMQRSDLDVTRAALAMPMAIYYDADYHEREIDVEAARPVARNMAVPKGQPGGKQLVLHELPGVENMACAVYQGGLDGLADASRTLLTWVEENGYRVSRPEPRHLLAEPGRGRAGRECRSERCSSRCRRNPSRCLSLNRRRKTLWNPRLSPNQPSKLSACYIRARTRTRRSPSYGESSMPADVRGSRTSTMALLGCASPPMRMASSNTWLRWAYRRSRICRRGWRYGTCRSNSTWCCPARCPRCTRLTAMRSRPGSRSRGMNTTRGSISSL